MKGDSVQAVDGVDYFFRRALWLAPAFGLILIGVLFFQPKLKPPPISFANGTYRNPCCQPLILANGLISSGDKSARYSIEIGKQGYYLNVPTGVRVEKTLVQFEGTFAFVFFDKNSELEKSITSPKVLHLGSLRDDREYLFLKDGVTGTAEAAASQ